MQLLSEQQQDAVQAGPCQDSSTHIQRCCISFNLQVVVGESLNRSIIIAICEDLILLYSSGFMDYIVYCYDLHCI